MHPEADETPRKTRANLVGARGKVGAAHGAGLLDAVSAEAVDAKAVEGMAAGQHQPPLPLRRQALSTSMGGYR